MYFLRPANPNDVNFVYSSWLKCYKHDSPQTRFTDRTLFFKKHQQLLDRILSSPQVTVTIASPDNEETICGYMVSEPGIIHFIYVKEGFRKFGIATKLIQTLEEPLRFSHLTDDLVELWRAGKFRFNGFDDYILRGL